MIDPNLICMNCMKELPREGAVCPHCGFDNSNCANTAHQLQCGSIIAGAYLIGRALGQGGFGITYIGLDLNLGIRVAIKEYYPEGNVTRDMITQSTVLALSSEKRAQFETGKERFVLEARVLAQFAGEKGIVGVRSFFHENGTAYIVMDFIEGETLKSYVAKRGGKLPAEEALSRIEALFHPLMLVHDAKLLHRDISPDNIMIARDGSLVLLDFGAARQISSNGEHSNTINVKQGFAPEEQYRKRGEQGAWTDVYALCATIYRLITGVTPPDALDRLRDDATLASPNSLGAGLTQAQERALLHGLAIDAKERTQDLKTLYAELYQGKTPILPVPIINKPPVSWGKFLPYIAAGLLAVFGLTALILAQTKSTQAPETVQAEETIEAEKTDSGGSTVLLPSDTDVTPTDSPNEGSTFAATDAPSRLSNSTVKYGIVAASIYNTLLLKSDGTVICLGSSDIDTTGWKNIKQLAATGDFAVGLQENGTLVAAGDLSHGENSVYNWQNVVQVDCGYQHVAGVTEDGYVLYAGTDKHNRSNCQNWSHVVRVLAGSDHLAAILDDGTVVAAGYSAAGRLATESFTDIVIGDVGGGTTFCVRSDGTVLATGENFEGEDNVQDWSNIVDIAASGEHTVGLRADGTVIATGSNKYGQCDTESWRDIVAIAAGGFFTVGVRADGTVVATGSNNKGQIDVSGIRLW